MHFVGEALNINSTFVYLQENSRQFQFRQKQKRITAGILRLMRIEAEQSQKLDAEQNTKLKIKDI